MRESPTGAAERPLPRASRGAEGERRGYRLRSRGVFMMVSLLLLQEVFLGEELQVSPEALR